MEGLALYYDMQKSAFCYAVTVFGSDKDGVCKSFRKQYSSDESNSKQPLTDFSSAYPKSKPVNPELGGWKGTFGNLTMLEVIAFDRSCLEKDNCITRRRGGLIDWSDTTIEKLDKSKPAGAKTMEEKQITLFLNMLQLTYELMMAPSACIRTTPFRSFMGASISLQKNKKQTTVADDDISSSLMVDGFGGSTSRA
jgi:hypothetical protein